MKVVKAPTSWDSSGMVIVFEAGSIEQDTAKPWQKQLEGELRDVGDDVLLLNPRRDSWDSSWEQSKDNPKFREQVEWELKGQENADVIAMYYDPDTKSPITLLEMGLFSDERLVVFCPKDFFRKGNVDIVCERYEIQQARSWDDFVAKVKAKISKARDGILLGVWNT